MQMKNSLTLSAEEVNDLLEKNTPFVVRIKMPSNETISFTDMIRGEISNDSNLVDDKVLLKGDGMPTYHLAVVVDDALQGITHIVRGQDLLSNTGRQIHLQNILGLPTPQYLHLPLVLDEHGEKLSKQTLATPIQTQNAKEALAELRKAAKHLGLRQLPDSENITIAEWLLAATHAWKA